MFDCFGSNCTSLERSSQKLSGDQLLFDFIFNFHCAINHQSGVASLCPAFQGYFRLISLSLSSIGPFDILDTNWKELIESF